MSLSGRGNRGAWGKIALVALGTPLGLLAADGCTQQQVATSIRSLERSGRVSFVCLSAPGVEVSPGRSIFDCSGTRYETPSDYGIIDGETTQPHLYALVTQTTRGEVAVVDMSTKTDSVLDENPRVPGANFLPVGAQPVDIVSTEDGDATFVAVAEIGRQGIFALPSTEIRSCSDCVAKNLSDWPACALPGAPGNMLIVNDPAEGETSRSSCDGAYEKIRMSEKDSAGKELINVANGKTEIFDDKGELVETKYHGRPKIVTTIPELGAVAIIDAQSLFEPERDANGKPVEDENGVKYNYPRGSWKACPIERWVPLSTKLPVDNVPPVGTGGPTCVDRVDTAPMAQVEFESQPAAMTRSGDRIFVSDVKAPIIHVLSMTTPCSPDEQEPLLPSSRQNPGRTVTTNAISATGNLSSSLKQFVYAVDDYDGSLMVFDVSPTSTTRRPLVRPNAPWTPLQPSDRVDVGVPVQDIALIEHDSPIVPPGASAAPQGIRCDPDPALTTCTSNSSLCDPETLYRTGAAYDVGAGPTRLRGSFAYLVLSTGQIAVVDIDDFDAQCRIPKRPAALQGCGPELIVDKETDPSLASSDEASCNVIVPHTLRSSNYVRTSDKTGQNQPGLQGFPVLYSDLGALQSTLDQNGIIMRATLPVLPEPPPPPPPAPPPAPPKLEVSQFLLSVGTALWSINQDLTPLPSGFQPAGLVLNGNEFQHTLAANLEDPRAFTSSQAFSVVYEGALPGFGGKAAKLDTKVTPALMNDASSRFCDTGVLGQKAFIEILKQEKPQTPLAQLETEALELADYVQITASTPAEDDTYWEGKTCSFEQCKSVFGPIEIPKTTRDFRIIEAYQDHLELDVPATLADDFACCFPSLVGFNVRVGNQWAVVGVSSGFMHHVIPTPAPSSTADRPVGVCRNSCDPRDSRRNGRVRSLPHEEDEDGDGVKEPIVVKDGDPYAFINPFFRFSINEAADGNEFDGNPNSKTDNRPKRGTFFQLNTQGSFKPLLVNLAVQTTEIQPQSIGFVPATNEVVIVDGSLEGIILLNAGRLDITRRYY